MEAASCRSFWRSAHRRCRIPPSCNSVLDVWPVMVSPGLSVMSAAVTRLILPRARRRRCLKRPCIGPVGQWSPETCACSCHWVWSRRPCGCRRGRCELRRRGAPDALWRRTCPFRGRRTVRWLEQRLREENPSQQSGRKSPQWHWRGGQEGAAPKRATSTVPAHDIREPRATARVKGGQTARCVGFDLPWLALARGTSSSELSNFIVGGRNRVGWWVLFGEAQRNGAAKAVSCANLGERLEFETERL